MERRVFTAGLFGTQEGESTAVVPPEFAEAVGLARDAGLGGDLRLLAHEARGFPWAVEGLKLVGRAQLTIAATAGAAETFEWLKALLPDDVEATQQLAAVDDATAVKKGRVLLFTGHMVDAEDRPTPRFPPTAAAEAEARRMIREAVGREKTLEGAPQGYQGHGPWLVGIAGGACGGDILFHEVCAELGIPTRLFLAVTKDKFVDESVRHGGPVWVERFNRLCERVPPRVMGGSTELPVWLRSQKGYSIWQRNNLWMLFNALALDRPLTLIALWDQGPADGPGGTTDLVAQADDREQKVVRLEAERLRTFR